MDRRVGQGSRFAAWRVLHDVRHGVPFDRALDRAAADLEPADRRLVHELTGGVFRSRTALDALIAPFVARGLESVRPDTLDLLRLGAFQLRLLDRIPAHAAVETTVAVARRLGGSRVAGFVNAVLRQIAATAPSAPDSAVTPSGDWATRFSHPDWLVARWLDHFGKDSTEQLLAWNNRRPPLVIQPARWTQEQLIEACRERNIPAEPAPFGAGLVVTGHRPEAIPGFSQGAFIVQDPAQALVTAFADLPPGSTLYDACAAPGGKTIRLALRARLVVAADRRLSKVRRLVQNLERAGNGRAMPIVADALHPPIRPVEAVLLDVPCSGTGTLSRNPDARWRITPAILQSLVDQGSRLLDAVATVVRPGGLLLYATCSLEPEENEEQVNRFLARHPEFRRAPSAITDPDTRTPLGDLMILPHRHGTDGAFAARLLRTA